MLATKSFPSDLLLALCVLAVFLPGCQPEEPEPEPEPAQRVENPEVGVVLTDVPDFFALEVNDGSRLELVPADGTTAGRVFVRAGEPETGGINLVAAVEEHKATILAASGEFQGQRELGTQMGTAFYSRGRFPDDGGQTTEETVIFMVHPLGDRTLQLVYRYPAGDDSKERIQDQLFSLLEVLEPLSESGASPAEE